MYAPIYTYDKTYLSERGFLHRWFLSLALTFMDVEYPPIPSSFFSLPWNLVRNLGLIVIYIYIGCDGNNISDYFIVWILVRA